jgi:hypothetical protein
MQQHFRQQPEVGLKPDLMQRIPRAFWRGANTGNYRGWSPDVLASMHDGGYRQADGMSKQEAVKWHPSPACILCTHPPTKLLESFPLPISHAGAMGTELLNKRTYASLHSLTHPWLDVGLSHIIK